MGDDALKALEDYKKEQGNYQDSIQFLNVQVDARQSLNIRLGEILQKAGKDYEEILGKKDAGRVIDLDLLLTIASIALPGLGAISTEIKTMEESESKLGNVLAHFGGNASDYTGVVQTMKSNYDANADDASSLTSGSSAVIRAVALKADKALGRTMLWRAFLTPVIKNNKFY